MKPDRPGIWEWFEEDGTRRLVEVYDVSSRLREAYPEEPPYLCVYWWGGYYNVNDEHDAENPEYDDLMKSEWPDRWGNRVGDNNSLPEEDLYLMPTPEQRAEIMKQYENQPNK